MLETENPIETLKGTTELNALSYVATVIAIVERLHAETKAMEEYLVDPENSPESLLRILVGGSSIVESCASTLQSAILQIRTFNRFLQ